MFDKLAVVAASGQQPFTLPDPRPFWQQLFNSQAPYQGHTWRLLDLSEVRHLYKDAQKRETLFRQHRKAQRQLEAAAQAAAEREEAAKRSRGFGFGSARSSSSSSTGSTPANGEGQGSSDAAAADGNAGSSGKKSVRASSLDDFMVVSEVLKPLGETPRDLLEDSYAIITRDGRCVKECWGSYNRLFVSFGAKQLLGRPSGRASQHCCHLAAFALRSIVWLACKHPHAQSLC